MKKLLRYIFRKQINFHLNALEEIEERKAFLRDNYDRFPEVIAPMVYMDYKLKRRAIKYLRKMKVL